MALERGQVVASEPSLPDLSERLKEVRDATRGAVMAVWATRWPGPLVLGSGGLFERVRFALDPGVNAGESLFYFGAVEAVAEPDERLFVARVR